METVDEKIPNSELENTPKTDTVDNESNDVFKVPTLTPSLTFKVKNKNVPPVSNVTTEKETPEASDVTDVEIKTTVKSDSQHSGDKEVVPIAYKEPKWSGLPTKPYSFEVIKNGVMLETIGLSTKPYTVCGRLANCDIVMEHPSISRYHAVVQYRTEANSTEAQPEGFYLYDVGSTHGTQINKNPIKPRTYYRLRVGYLIKFGGSSRNYILQGPAEDEEEESPLTVTEIKEQRVQEELKQKLEEELRIRKKQEAENEGVNWGMGEDAEEDEDESNDVNPFALDAKATNEDSYFDDPKKALRKWFEREGYSLEYKVDELGQAHFACCIELPIDTASGRGVTAEAKVKGKKKEAVAACALEACRILDRQGLLRQSTAKSRKVEKKNWEDDDYYDSDEDTFLDRTGTIEKKRQQRLRNAGKAKDVVETYDSLLQKHNAILEQISELEATLYKDKEKEKTADEEIEDSLEQFMKSINSEKTMDKSVKTNLKLKIAQLKLEEKQIAKLVAIAKPANLSILIPSPVVAAPATNISPEKPPSTKFNDENKHVDIPKGKIMETNNDDDLKIVSEEKETDSIKDECQKPTAAENVNLDNETSKTDEIVSPPVNRGEKRKDSKDKKKQQSKRAMLKYEYDNEDPNYAMWMPPDDQSGDGKTRLNDKFGY